MDFQLHVAFKTMHLLMLMLMFSVSRPSICCILEEIVLSLIIIPKIVLSHAALHGVLCVLFASYCEAIELCFMFACFTPYNYSKLFLSCLLVVVYMFVYVALSRLYLVPT